MCPPDIYGPGRGPGRTQSSHIPAEWDEIRKIGHPFYAGDGTNTKSWVHMEDLMMLYLKVVEAAAAGGRGADWGKEVCPPGLPVTFLLIDNSRRVTTSHPRKKCRRSTSRKPLVRS